MKKWFFHTFANRFQTRWYDWHKWHIRVNQCYSGNIKNCNRFCGDCLQQVITKNEYYELFKITPANMESVVDASFLITCPDFRINDIDAAKWTIGGENLPNDVKSHVYFGDKKMYKTYDLIGRVSSSMFLFLVSKTM